jgi:hypothetical protein
MATYGFRIVVLVAGLLTMCVGSLAAEDIKLDKLPPAKERLVEPRLDALEKSVDSIVEMLRMMKKESQIKSQKCTTVGCRCRLVKECCHITCCRWGPPGDGGTAVCLDPCCGAYCETLKCD